MRTMQEMSHASAETFWLTFVQPRIAHIQSVHPFQDSTLVQDALGTLDKELTAMHLAMCSLRTRRNALVPVSSLPQEVLARVFHFQACVEPPSSRVPSRGSVRPRGLLRGPSRLGWIRVTHICKHWRDVALHNPSLWSEIDTSILTQRPDSRWPSLILDRAKATPLSFRSTGAHQSLVTTHLSHIRHLSLSGSAIDLSQSLALPAPIIQTLDLSASSSQHTSLSPKLLGDYSPVLRHVRLDGVWIPWSSSIFCSLTHLRVKLDSRGGHLVKTLTKTTYADFLHALERLSTLETLVIENCLPVKSQASVNSRVELASLRLLSLVDTPEDCANVLRSLKIPPQCRLHLDCIKGIHELTNGQYAHVCSLFSAHAGASGDKAPLLSLSITFPKGKAQMKVWRASRTLDDGPLSDPHEDPDLSIIVQPPSLSLPLLENLCRGLPLERIRGLSIEQGPDCPGCKWTHRKWISAFGQCKLIEHIHATDKDAIGLCKALSWHTDTAKTQIFLPKLRSLKVEQVNFSTSVEGDEFGFTFVKWWAWRSQKVKELPTLFMRDCELDAGTEEVFRINNINYMDLEDISGSGSSGSDEEDVDDEQLEDYQDSDEESDMGW